MSRAKTLFKLFLPCFLLSTSSAYAWQVELNNNSHLPENVIGVSKNDSSLYVVDAQKNITIKEAFQSIHGRVEGEKTLEGDLKTPEGVYFVTTKIRSELDFIKYGTGAYALNYPNPIDKIKQKTGHGIWIHSKGNPIEGQRTEGCVAVDLDDFELLGEYLPKGTPVVLAGNINELPADELAKFEERFKKEPLIESLANQEVAPQSEELINEQKIEDLFTQSVDNLNGQAESENSTEIIEEVVIAEPKPRSLPYFTLETAQAIAGTIPQDALHDLEETNFSTDIPDLAKESAETPLEVVNLSIEGSNLEENLDTTSEANFYEAPAVISNEADFLVEMTKKWNKAWEDRSDEFFNFYDVNKYGLAQSESYNEFQAQKKGLFKTLPWIQIIHGDIYALEGTDYWVTWFEQLYKAPNTTAEGTRRLYWQKDEMGEFKVVAMEWIPAKVGIEDMYMATITPEIEAALEGWKMAWLSGNVEKYKTYYAENARQDARKGEEIFEHKTGLWVVKQPKTIEFSDIKITSYGKNVLVSMRQKYSDSTGYNDYGRKQIYFTLIDGKWVIERESWSRI